MYNFKTVMSVHGCYCAWTAWAKLVPSTSMLKKATWGQVWTRRQRAMYCFLQFTKARYTLEITTHLKFSSKPNWEQMKKLDSFCKKLSANQVKIFHFKYGKVKYQLVFLWLLTTLTDNSRLKLFHSQCALI